MRERAHEYAATVAWIGAEAGSTATYAGYSREHTIAFDDSDLVLRGSADPAFRGDATLVNPEQLLLAALSACHLLSYLALCALEGIELVSYSDAARGTMREAGGSGRFTEVTLRPAVVVADASSTERALALHAAAHATCFVANSMNFPVRVDARVYAG